jgi:nicotinate-nucleotide adenylyltransferase
VVERPGYALDLGGSHQMPELPYRTDVIEAPLCDVSSTDIRNRIGAGRSIRFLVPEAVRAYIDQHNLFRYAR